HAPNRQASHIPVRSRNCDPQRLRPPAVRALAKSLGPYWCSCCVSGRRTFRSTPARLAAPAQWLAPILAPLLWLDRSRATAARATDELARRPVWFGRPSAQSRVLARAVH